jgi:GT2 family glycosyltransferase
MRHSEHPTASVIMPCLNARSTIAAQLEALAGQTWRGEWELLAVDNGSTDDTVATIERFSERLPIRVVEAGPPPGAARARNLGARVARGRLLVFCDADDVVDSRWLEEMIAALDRHELVAARAEHAALNETWTRAGREELSLPRLPFPPYLPFASTYGLGVRRELHDEVGGFDQSLAALDDVDYTLRLQLAGARLVQAERAVVHYRNRKTLSGIYRQARSYAEDFALLQRRYGSGRTLPRWKSPLLGWKAILATIPHIGSRAGRGTLAWRLGWQMGRITGSVRYRVHPQF